jgi:predicted RNase H-like HicB family nuclease
MPATHGETYRDAVEQGQKVLEMLVKSAQEEGESLPQPGVYVA